MERIKKYLVLHLNVVNARGVTFHIADQSHRGMDFGPRVGGYNGSTFSASNDIQLISASHLEWSQRDKILYVRGSNSSKDERAITVSVYDYGCIETAVYEYNKHFGGKDRVTEYLPDEMFKI